MKFVLPLAKNVLCPLKSRSGALLVDTNVLKNILAHKQQN